MDLIEISNRIKQVKKWNRNNSIGILITFTRDNMYQTATTISQALIHPSIKTGLPSVKTDHPLFSYIPLDDISIESEETASFMKQINIFDDARAELERHSV